MPLVTFLSHRGAVSRYTEVAVGTKMTSISTYLFFKKFDHLVHTIKIFKLMKQFLIRFDLKQFTCRLSGFSLIYTFNYGAKLDEISENLQ